MKEKAASLPLTSGTQQHHHQHRQLTRTSSLYSEKNLKSTSQQKKYEKNIIRAKYVVSCCTCVLGQQFPRKKTEKRKSLNSLHFCSVLYLLFSSVWGEKGTRKMRRKEISSLTGREGTKKVERRNRWEKSCLSAKTKSDVLTWFFFLVQYICTLSFPCAYYSLLSSWFAGAAPFDFPLIACLHSH